jgi:DTW domain-containing protein
VLVLQHPQEQRQAKNSVSMLRLSLAHCEVVVGEYFAPTALAALLQRPGWDTRLLYPDVPAAPAPLASGTAAGACVRLVVIDATWRKSLRMLLEHPALAALPRLSLDAPAPTRYRTIRPARRSDQVSTLEATVQALAMLEGPSFDAAPLLDAFGQFVTALAARQRPQASAGQGSPAPFSSTLFHCAPRQTHGQAVATPDPERRGQAEGRGGVGEPGRDRCRDQGCPSNCP